MSKHYTVSNSMQLVTWKEMMCWLEKPSSLLFPALMSLMFSVLRLAMLSAKSIFTNIDTEFHVGREMRITDWTWRKNVTFKKLMIETVELVKKVCWTPVNVTYFEFASAAGHSADGAHPHSFLSLEGVKKMYIREYQRNRLYHVSM